MSDHAILRSARDDRAQSDYERELLRRETEAEAIRDENLADAQERIADLRADRDTAADLQIEALQSKLDALAPHGSCACSYDTPDDVCEHHSPKLAAALARAEKAEAERDAAHADLRERFHSAAVLSAVWGEDIHELLARATTAEAEVSRLTALIDEAREVIERRLDESIDTFEIDVHGTPWADKVSIDGCTRFCRASDAAKLIIDIRALLPRLTKEPSHAE